MTTIADRVQGLRRYYSLLQTNDKKPKMRLFNFHKEQYYEFP